MSDVLINPARVRRVKPLSAEEVVSAVERALLTEVRLTPKPGLVDIRNAGAHWDMDLASFEASTAVVAPWMEKFFHHGPRYCGGRAGAGIDDAAPGRDGL